ncbi:Cof-type HAD-IIB family hydrolase [Caviibacter abscessus]|uniref:Cof-type HAD-IIB family hydrolase n=1 Tax=Caviibacter abscessus TaxID=1766719 RepID=UPI0009EA1E0F|nr:Cof-type HAD-IIB family hydrolase [Caviibacter abscessus]
MYKLIATDMDDTLLTSQKNISPENMKSIIKAQEKGIKFVLASGRPTFAMNDFANQLQLEKFGGYIISYNGAAITDCKTNETIFSLGLNKEDIFFLFDKANEYNVSIITYNDDVILYNKYTEYIDLEVECTNFKTKQILDLSSIDFTKTMKCMIIAHPEKIKELYLKLKTIVGDKYYLSISNPHFLEITNINVNKGNTIKYLCDILNIDASEIIACGDSYNDLDMLKLAGLSVAAGNALDDIKKICKYVSVNHNENILEDVIKKYL